jgi:MoaA/NifB/PqqE/SkfB family radical SAM enzyme/peroxiredoxin
VGRRADLKTGYDCNSNCVFCVIGDKLFTGNRSLAECVEELQLSRATCDAVVFTGAEVTIRPDFFELVGHARRLGYRDIQIQTNGRMFAYADFCKKAIAAGANEFSPSIHGHTAKLHDGLTRAPGSFDQIVRAIRNLRALGQRIITNTVATKQNQPHLPALARMLVELGVDQFQIAFPHPTGHAATYFNGVIPRMQALSPFVRAALQIGRDAGVACMAEAMPFCQLPGYEAQVAELHIPPTEIVYDGFVVPDYQRDRMERGKTRFAQCASCRFEPICEGPWREYPEELGSDEFQPVAGPRVIDPALVLDDRFARLGTPAPEVASDDRSARWLAVAFYPEDGSPACTAEACSLQAGLDGLTAAGVALVGVSPDGEARHAAFARTHGLAFPLVADERLALARAFGAVDLSTGGLRRSTYLLDGERKIAHIVVAPDVRRHAAEILDAIRRLQAPPRPLERGEELVVIRRPKRKSEAEALAELDLE